MKLAAALEIALLGGFQVRIGQRVVQDAEWRLRKARNLVKLLALAPRHRLQREQVMEILWPEHDPEAAANNLHKAIYFARRALEPGMIASIPSVYIRLEWNTVLLDGPGGVHVDVDGFESAAMLARASGAPTDYAAAIERYTGDLLPEDRYEDWAAARRDLLEGQYITLLLAQAAVQADHGQPYAAIDALSRVVAHEPIHEEAHLALMRLYARTGQRHHALRQYQQLRAALKRELDLDPTPVSTELYQALATTSRRSPPRSRIARMIRAAHRCTARSTRQTSTPGAAGVADWLRAARPPRSPTPGGGARTTRAS
jgi:DNA-binding SARP family transcriptional activator